MGNKLLDSVEISGIEACYQIYNWHVYSHHPSDERVIGKQEDILRE